MELIIIEKVNEHLLYYSLNYLVSSLLGTRPGEVDIRNFKVENIEICFNVWLKNNYVKQYIEFFNLIFKDKADKRYKNFALEQGKDIDTSFYVKSSVQYRDNLNTNYVVNFYNKYNQLENLKDEGSKITKDELERAEGLLRLEIQLYYIAIKDICNRHKLDKQFNSFLDIELCLDILKEKYNKMLNRLKIHQYFIPTRFKIDYMKSPIRLLNQKLNHYKKMNKRYKNNTLRSITDGEFYSI